jgi:hypothetical protein
LAAVVRILGSTDDSNAQSLRSCRHSLAQIQRVGKKEAITAIITTTTEAQEESVAAIQTESKESAEGTPTATESHSEKHNKNGCQERLEPVVRHNPKGRRGRGLGASTPGGASSRRAGRVPSLLSQHTNS